MPGPDHRQPSASDCFLVGVIAVLPREKSLNPLFPRFPLPLLLPDSLAPQIKSARHEIMGPMSAAAMESHSRAYPHVVRLHMLQVLAGLWVEGVGG